jgi:hypothetical protein
MLVDESALVQLHDLISKFGNEANKKSTERDSIQNKLI